MARMNRQKRKTLWGCLASIGSLSFGLVMGLYFYYKPEGENDRAFMDRLMHFAFILCVGLAEAICAWMGGWTDVTTALFIVAIVDYVTGFTAALFHKSKKTKNGGLSSKVGFYGIMKKVMLFLAIIVAHQIDVVVYPDGTPVFRTIVTGLLLGNEGLSCYENLALFGIPFPKKLRSMLEQLRNGENCQEISTQERKDDNG